MHSKTLKIYSPLWICVCAMFLALIIILSSFGIPVPGGKLYLVDLAVVMASLLLDPVSAMMVSGLGAFMGDALFYPAPMFVSLVVHGFQAYAISWLYRHLPVKNSYGRAMIACTVGVVILVTGYTLGKIFIYSTLEYALIKLPFEILQGFVGMIGGMSAVFGLHLNTALEKIAQRHV